MPKQIFQRPAPVKHNKIGAIKGGPASAPDWGRKKGTKPPKKPETTVSKQAPKDK